MINIYEFGVNMGEYVCKYFYIGVVNLTKDQYDQASVNMIK